MSEADAASAVKAAQGLDCDIIEVRVDHMRDTGNLGLLKDIKQKLIVTCMPEWEGGLFKGMEEDRIAILRGALEYADYVSVELKMEKRFQDALIMEAGRKGVKVIVCQHDFEKTPPAQEIIELLTKMESVGADIAKVAFQAKNRLDVVNVLGAQVAADLKIPVIALSMGPLGKASRVAGPMLGGYLMFAAPANGKSTASGQYTLDEMKQIRRLVWDEDS